MSCCSIFQHGTSHPHTGSPPLVAGRTGVTQGHPPTPTWGQDTATSPTAGTKFATKISRGSTSPSGSGGDG